MQLVARSARVSRRIQVRHGILYLVAEPPDVKGVGRRKGQRGAAREAFATQKQQGGRVGRVWRPAPLGDVAVLRGRERKRL